MKVTVEVLKRYNANQQAIDLIAEKYPDGVECLDLIKDIKIPKEWLFFAKKYFSLTPEELQKYNELCNIKDCKDNIWYSTDVSRSDVVVNSKNVVESERIYDSRDIEHSVLVYSSEYITWCNSVEYSKGVRLSNLIVESEDVVTSRSVLHSRLVTRSNNILNCTNTLSCWYLYKCNNVVDCAFCGFLNDCQHCLFCDGLQGEEYCIFNQKVDRALFEQIKEQMLYKLEMEQSTFIVTSELEGLNKFLFNNRFDSVFDGLSDEFYGWISTLPNYTDDLFVNLFFRSK